MSEHSPPRPPPPDPLAALGQITGELVHDLANELQVLEGWAMLARGEARAGQPPVRETQRMAEITSRLGRMLRDVLETTAGQTLSPEVTFDPVSLTATTLNERVRELTALNVQLVSHLPPEVRVHGRASFWARIVANLLSNAARYAYRHVRIQLEAEQEPGERLWVVLRMEDDGPGVGAAQREVIFQPLWRGSAGGTGLGLSSVAWAAEQLQGTVRYRADGVLGGAGFEVRVPAAIPLRGASAPSPPPEAGLDTLRGLRLVLIDDDPSVRLALSRLLQRAGAEVREIHPTGMPEERLIEAVLRALPDVILLDLHLGDRGGVGLWRRLQAEVPHLGARVAFLSGSMPGDATWEEARATGQPVLPKPFDFAQLLRTLVRLQSGG